MTLGWQKFTDPATEGVPLPRRVAHVRSGWILGHDYTFAGARGPLTSGRSGPRSCGREAHDGRPVGWLV